ncbi:MULTISPECIES: hypothetical protein [Streptomyces]|uniref:hypothetical protein n=1 Tax=Streptomyces TaxID=1883 RepID=UPI0016753959|nr:hypothetical protein [Streptomyces canarius]
MDKSRRHLGTPFVVPDALVRVPDAHVVDVLAEEESAACPSAFTEANPSAVAVAQSGTAAEARGWAPGARRP